MNTSESLSTQICTPGLQDYKAYQTKMEAYLQDRAFLTKQLLRVNSNSSQSAALFDLRYYNILTVISWDRSESASTVFLYRTC